MKAVVYSIELRYSRYTTRPNDLPNKCICRGVYPLMAINPALALRRNFRDYF